MVYLQLTDLLKRTLSSVSSFSPFNFVMLLCFPSYRQLILVLRRISVTAGSSLNFGSEEENQRTLLFYRSAVQLMLTDFKKKHVRTNLLSYTTRWPVLSNSCACMCLLYLISSLVYFII